MRGEVFGVGFGFLLFFFLSFSLFFPPTTSANVAGGVHGAHGMAALGMQSWEHSLPQHPARSAKAAGVQAEPTEGGRGAVKGCGRLPASLPRPRSRRLVLFSLANRHCSL